MTKRLEVIKTYKLYINGAFPRSESGRSIAVEDGNGNLIAHVSHGSRKDLREAVEAASAAQPKWGDMTAYNRAQILYRMAEMMEGKRDEFIEALRDYKSKNLKIQKSTSEKSKGRKVERRNAPGSSGWQPAAELDACIDRLICFAGWADKYAQILGCNNPVAGPYYNFTIPEPTGVVGVLAPIENGPALLGLISLLAPPLCAGNAIVAIADEGAMVPASIFGEVCATSDVPPGVINIITSKRPELIDHLARHRNVNAISAANLPRDAASVLRMGVAENLKRVHIAKITADEWFDADVCESPWTIEPFVEMKTIWHPMAV